MVKEGDRIELVSTSDPHTNLESGDKGTVTDTSVLPAEVTPHGRPQTQIWVDWDTGSTLALLQGEDEFKVITD